MNKKLKGEELRKRIREVNAQFEEMIRTHGWASHYVPLDSKHINYHTHGVQENFKHLDFQITLPMDMRTAHTLVGYFIEDVKNGKVFEEGVEYQGYIKVGYPLTVKKFMENGREVLRIIYPDENKVLPTDTTKFCKPDYKRQLDVLKGD